MLLISIISGGATLTWSEESELFRFLRYANLQMYMEVFIAKDIGLEDLLGADDDEELDEILDKINMHINQFHVKKIKKKLLEWPQLLFKACEDNNLPEFKKLLESGPDPTRVKKDNGTNVLFLMAEKNQVDMARLCIDAIKDNPGRLSNLVNNARKSDGKKISYLVYIEVDALVSKLYRVRHMVAEIQGEESGFGLYFDD